jgi:hypothetical protein
MIPADQAHFKLADALLNVVLTLPPSPRIAVIAAIATNAAIRPYSIAVAPFELPKNFLNCIVGSPE